MARLITTARATGTYGKTKSYISKEELRKKHKRERINKRNGRN